MHSLCPPAPSHASAKFGSSWDGDRGDDIKDSPHGDVDTDADTEEEMDLLRAINSLHRVMDSYHSRGLLDSVALERRLFFARDFHKAIPCEEDYMFRLRRALFVFVKWFRSSAANAERFQALCETVAACENTYSWLVKRSSCGGDVCCDSKSEESS